MICANCGTENKAGRKFCVECGSPLSVICPNCGEPIQPGEKFCGNCGTSIQGIAPASESAASEASEAAPVAVAERRLVSVLFADLVGFTTLSEALDAEEVRELQERYFETARQVIERYGGTVEKFIGDAVMAVWGAPTAHEDDAERAVRAALELVDAVRGLVPAGELKEHRLEVRSGVLTGAAAVSLAAMGQGMVAGDLVNSASRLQAVAPPGAVLVGEATYRAAKDAIAFESVEDQQLKGKTLPVRAWKAVQVVAMLGGSGRSERLDAPFVGRDAEFRLIKELLHATARERRLRLVSVTGIAGIGKSRLAWEVLKYLDGLVENVYWHQGRSPAYGEGVTFWALGEMIRRRAGIAEADDDSTTRQKLAATLAAFVPEDSERRWIGPRLEALLGLQEAPSGEREELFASWRRFFELIADEAPAIMVFEELQWADGGLIDFIESMLEWSRSLPIFIITLARPEFLERRPTWGAGQRNFIAIHLEPLDDGAMRQLLDGLVPGLPTAVLKQIIGRADGVPLYAVETIRSLVDAGLLLEEEGRYRVAGDLSRLTVPDTLHALIAARLDGLEAADRTLVQACAVLGLTFTVPALNALTGRPGPELEERLRGLVRKEVVELDADPLSPERGQYGFVQGLIREVAHETISRRDRRIQHLAAARYFESLDEEELAGVLASHYLQAFEATPAGPEADALAAQARVALRAAADRAANLHSHEQALAFLGQAEAVTPDPADRAVLWERMAEAARSTGSYDIAVGRLEQAIEWYVRQGNTEPAARLTGRLCEILIRDGKVDAAIRRLKSVLDTELPPRETARLSAVLGRAYMLHGERTSALELIERALPIAGEAGDVEVVVEALASKGALLDSRPHEAQAILYGAVAVANSHGLANTRARAAYNLAGVLYSDDPGSAFRVLREDLEIAHRTGQRGWFHSTAGFALGAAIDAGEWDWAADLAAELQDTDMSANERVEASSWASLIPAYRGDMDEAERRLETATTALEQVTDTVRHGGYWSARSMVLYAAGRFDEALSAGLRSAEVDPAEAFIGHYCAAPAAFRLGDVEQVRSSLAVMEATVWRGRYITAGQDHVRGLLLGLEGNATQASSLLGEVIRRFRDLGSPNDAAIATLGYVTAVGMDDPGVRMAAEEARVWWTKLGARAMLEQLDRATASRPISAQHLPVKPSREEAVYGSRP